MSARIKISLVILTCNRKENLSLLLNDLKRQEFQPDEIIVVDNNSEDGTLEFLQQHHPETTPLWLEKNVGCAGRNEGIKKASGDLVITIDDDIFLHKADCIQSIAAIFQENSNIVALNFKVLDYSTKELISFNWFHPYKMEEYCDKDFVTDYISEGAVAFRKKLFDEVGYYPAEFFLSHEGPDLAYRIIDAGYDIHYSHEIEVLHNCSTYQRDSWRNTYYDTRNHIWLAIRNLPFARATLHICYRLATTLLFALRRKQFRWYCKALLDAIKKIPDQLKHRHPISRQTLKRIKHIRQHKPGFLYQITSFLKRTRSINAKFGR